MNEMGVGFSYNTLFKSFYAGSFNAATDEVIIGVDSSRDSNVMPIKGDTQVVSDIFLNRSDKSGVLATEDIGFAILDRRSVSALIVNG
jgi:hypothetical protein